MMLFLDTILEHKHAQMDYYKQVSSKHKSTVKEMAIEM